MLTVDELRKHVETPLENDALQRLLDATEEALGSVTRTERVTPIGDLLPLSSRPSAVTSVVENDETLAANDYTIAGHLLIRSNEGTNPRRVWYRSPVVVTYTVQVNTATRELVAISLIQQFLNYNPGLSQETIGSWSQQYAANSVYNFAIERANILKMLDESNPIWPR